MSQDYAKVLNALDSWFEVIGRSVDSALNFFNSTGQKVQNGGFQDQQHKSFLKNYDSLIKCFIDNQYRSIF